MDFYERDIIYILNSLNITIHLLKWHNSEEKGFLEHFFNFNNYDDDYDYIRTLQWRIGLHYNRVLYNGIDEIHFKGQKDYLLTKEKDFKILFDNSRYKTKFINNIKHTKIDKFNYFKNKFNLFK